LLARTILFNFTVFIYSYSFIILVQLSFIVVRIVLYSKWLFEVSLPCQFYILLSINFVGYFFPTKLSCFYLFDSLIKLKKVIYNFYIFVRHSFKDNNLFCTKNLITMLTIIMFTMYIEMDTCFCFNYKRSFCFLGCFFESYSYHTDLGNGFFHCGLNLHFLMSHCLVSSDVMLLICLSGCCQKVEKKVLFLGRIHKFKRS